MAILFSYLFLDNYRSLEKREICFDHRYKFDETTNTVMKEDDQKGGFGSYFYGKNIYSATCLVGKNGEGKTSCIDFLRDSFALIKFNLDSGRLLYQKDRNGVVDLPEGEIRRYHLDAGMRFLVIFKSGDTDYYVTNMGEVRLDKGASKKCQAYIPKNNEGDIEYRIAYFSMLRLPDGVTAEQRAFIRKRDAESTEEGYYNQKITDIQTLSEQYMYDLSEESLNALRVKKRDGFNADLLMQMAFFENGDSDLLEDILGKDYETRVGLAGVETGDERIDVKALKDNSSTMKMPLLDALKETTAYFWPFSSGHYSRFAFLSRLYWFMG